MSGTAPGIAGVRLEHTGARDIGRSTPLVIFTLIFPVQQPGYASLFGTGKGMILFHSIHDGGGSRAGGGSSRSILLAHAATVITTMIAAKDKRMRGGPVKTAVC